MTKDALLAARSQQDPLQVHRKRIIYSAAIAAVICLLPFSISEFVRGRVTLGLAILIVTLILAIDAAAVYRKKNLPIPFALLFIPIAAGIVISVQTQGIYGAVWCYPAAFFSFFVFSRRIANLCGAVLVIFTALAVYAKADNGIAIGFSVTLTLTIVGINIVHTVISDLQSRLLNQAITDPLTGAYNRRYMQECLEDAIERTRRTALPATILMIDVDHFKRINESFGREAGDTVLKEFVDLIRTRLRRLDLLFRLGGEEFLLLLPDTKAADALNVAEQLRATVAESRFSIRTPVFVSIGVSEHQPGQSYDEWIKRVDEALYMAKEGGRNRVLSTESPITLDSPRAKTMAVRTEQRS